MSKKDKPTLDGLNHNQSKVWSTTVSEIVEIQKKKEKLQKEEGAKFKYLKNEIQADIGDMRAVVKQERAANANHLRSERSREVLREALGLQTVFDFINTGEEEPTEDVLDNVKKMKKSA